MRLTQRVIQSGLAAMFWSLSFSAEAQQPNRLHRVGYLSPQTSLNGSPGIESFRQGLKALGYVEGQNIVIEWRFAKGNLNRHPELAAELVLLKVDCIITVGRSPTQAAKQATSTIPIVMGNVSDDPIRHGLVASLARPGGNITGFTDIAPDLAGKRLELLKEAVTKAARVAILWYPNPVSTTQFKETEIAARALRVQLQSLKVRGSDDLESAFQPQTTSMQTHSS